MDSSTDILLTGATGLLGRSFVEAFAGRCRLWPQGHLHELDHPRYLSLDLLDSTATVDLLRRIRPAAIIHLAALTNVDTCEDDPLSAYRINVEATRVLADWMRREQPDGLFVYVSTDQVYDGPGPHTEDQVAPRNVYAMTKLWAEDVVGRLQNSIVVRLNFFAAGSAAHHRGLVRWLRTSLAEGEAVTLFDDVVFNPLHARQIADTVREMMQHDIRGVFNLGASDFCSKADFAEMVAARYGLPLDHARRASIDEVPMKAVRPKDMRMSTDRLATCLGRPMPAVRDGIDMLTPGGCDTTC